MTQDSISCTNCLTALPGGARFCVRCGRAVESVRTPWSAPSVPSVRDDVPLPPAAPPFVGHLAGSAGPPESIPAAYVGASADALRRQMAVAGGLLGLSLALGLGFAGRFVFGVLGMPPSMATLPLILLVVAAIPWLFWLHSRGRTTLLAETDPHEIRSIWLVSAGALLGGVLAGAVLAILAVGFRLGVLLAVEVFARWLVSALVVGGLLVGLGVVLDGRRQTRLPARAPAARSSSAVSDMRGVYVRGGLRLIAIGVGMIVLGLICTALLSAFLAGSGGAIVAVGALAVGAVNIVRGLYYLLVRGLMR